MTRPENIDFFELSDKILERLNEEGNVNLTHYDIHLKIRRDTNYPSDKFNIYLYVFDEEYSNTYFTLDYNTVTKIVNILFLHAADDYGYVNTRHGLILTKICSLENRLQETIEKCGKLVIENLKLTNESDLLIDVDEQYPFDNLDKNGLPYFQLNFILQGQRLIKLPLDSNSSDYSNQKEILEQLETSLKRW